MSRHRHSGKVPFEFIAIPKAVLSGTAYQQLPAHAKALMFDLAAQYGGRNNGRLCPSYTAMERSGWASKATLLRAKAALLECPFVVRTRMGRPPRTPEWLAFTWWPLDFHPSMEIDPKLFPYLNFISIADAMIDPNEGRKPSRKLDSVVPKRDRYPRKTALRGTETRPMEAAE